MEEIIVKGGQRLEGIVKVEGAKNAVLPILAASILAQEQRVQLDNVPNLSDVHTLQGYWGNGIVVAPVAYSKQKKRNQ